jgi:uncharacterized membrane protein YdbT with pleckstrin-like domain
MTIYRLFINDSYQTAHAVVDGGCRLKSFLEYIIDGVSETMRVMTIRTFLIVRHSVLIRLRKELEMLTSKTVSVRIEPPDSINFTTSLESCRVVKVMVARRVPSSDAWIACQDSKRMDHGVQ